MGATEKARRVEAARAEFFASGSVDDAVVDDKILCSWQRSRVAGVDINTPQVPYGDEFDLRSRLVQYATPMVQRPHEQLDELPVSIMLTDDEGRLLDRKDSSHRLARHLDAVYFAPGFSYTEAHVGTNGVGTALEDCQPVFVSDPEHFNERSRPFACAGAPIRNPLTRCVEGLIDLTCLTEDAHPMMRVLVQEAAHEVEQQLLEDGSERQRLVPERFLTTCRRSSGAVVSVSQDIVMSNERLRDCSPLRTRRSYGNSPPTSATARPTPPPRFHSPTTGEPTSSVTQSSTAPEPPERHSNCTYPAHHRFGARRHASRCTAGCPQSPCPVSPDARNHGSKQRHSFAKRRNVRDSVLVLGEHGVGKLALVKGVHRDRTPTGRLVIVECDKDDDSTLADLIGNDKTSAQTVVFRHLDRLSPSSSDELVALLDEFTQKDTQPWIVATAGTVVGTIEPVLTDFDAIVAVPPLRHRVDDIPDLVPVLLHQISRSREVRCTDEVMRTLSRNVGPENVAELEEGLRAAVRNRAAGVIQLEDLAPTCFTMSRRTLTAMEELERDAIIRALIRANGNRKEAASNLGISRSSLYRKLHNFGISNA